MAADPRMLDDVAKVVSSAMGTAFGMRDEVETRMRARLQSALSRMDLVTREDFEAVRDLAANARAEQEVLAERVAALETRIDELETALKTVTVARKAAPRPRAGTARKGPAKTAQPKTQD